MFIMKKMSLALDCIGNNNLAVTWYTFLFLFYLLDIVALSSCHLGS